MRRQHQAADDEFLGLVAMHFAEQIGAVGHLQSGGTHYGQRFHAGGADHFHLGDGIGGEAELAAFAGQLVVGHQRRHREGTLPGRESCCLRLAQVAVFQRMHACFHAAANGVIGVEMGGHLGAGHAGLFDHGVQLAAGKSVEVDWIGWRGAAAIGHDLDEIGTALDFLARGPAHFVDAVADAAE